MSDDDPSASGDTEQAAPTEVGRDAAPAPIGWRVTFAVLALVPFGAVAGAIAHPDHFSHHEVAVDLVIGGLVGGFVALLAAPCVRLAHRFATEWLALLLGAGAWVLSGFVADVDPPHLRSFASRVDYHFACVREGLEVGNLGGSSAALLLGAIAVVLSLLLESRRDRAQRPISRVVTLLSLAPLASTALLAAYAAEMWGFVLIAIALASFATLRVATRVRLEDPRSLALGIASVLAGGLAIEAATSGATTHALALAMDVMRSTHAPTPLVPALARIDAARLASVAPVLAVFPAIGLAFALEGRVRVALPRRAVVLTAAVLALLIWLDARNLQDLRTHVETYAVASGARDLGVAAGDLSFPTIDGEGRPDGSFVVLSREGDAWYRGRARPRGRGGLRGLAQGGVAPALLMDASSLAPEVQAAVTAVGYRGPTAFVGLSGGGTHLAQVTVGRWVSGIVQSDERILLFVQITEVGCVIASTAGERIDIPDCETEVLRTRLEERRAAEPNRHDIILAPEPLITLQQILDVAVLLDETGFDERLVADGVML